MTLYLGSNSQKFITISSHVDTHLRSFLWTWPIFLVDFTIFYKFQNCYKFFSFFVFSYFSSFKKIILWTRHVSMKFENGRTSHTCMNIDQRQFSRYTLVEVMPPEYKTVPKLNSQNEIQWTDVCITNCKLCILIWQNATWSKLLSVAKPFNWRSCCSVHMKIWGTIKKLKMIHSSIHHKFIHRSSSVFL